MTFLLRSIYTFHNGYGVAVECGLVHNNYYEPAMRIALIKSNTSVNNESDCKSEYDPAAAAADHQPSTSSIILGQIEFYQFTKFLEEVVAQNLLTAGEDVVDGRRRHHYHNLQPQSPLGRDDDDDDGNTVSSVIGDYIVEVIKNQNIIRIKKRIYYLLEFEPLLELNTNMFIYEFLKMKTVIKYKLKFLRNYTIYALLTHAKIVNYYLNLFKTRQLTADNFCNLALSDFASQLVTLKSCDLPKGPIMLDIYNNFDINVCELVDSEIRLCAYSTLFMNIMSILALNDINPKLIPDFWWYPNDSTSRKKSSTSILEDAILYGNII